jgi:hypothetical protein
MKNIIFIVFLLFVPQTTRAETTTAYMMTACAPVVRALDLQDGGARVEATYESGLCVGAFLSLLNLSYIYIEGEATPTTIIYSCPPPGVSVQQMVRIFYRYAGDHPEAHHINYIISAMTAMRRAFPCNDVLGAKK